MTHVYPTPAAFDRALKKAIRSMDIDPGEGYRQALRDRFLCRVFYKGGGRFALKGGSGLLARIPDARATRDLDFAAMERSSADEALEEMKRIADLDLGDWCRFELTKAEESLDENGYSRLLKLRFATYVGAEEKDPVLIDLSLGCAPTLPPEQITPANRVNVKGVEVCDYLVYSLPDQLADKLCAIVERQPGGWPSSRMKDLVDVVVYALNEDFDLGQLAAAIASECSKRRMSVPSKFEAPLEWSGSFSTFAKRCGLPAGFQTFDRASKLASSFFGPALTYPQEAKLKWDHTALTWNS